MNILQKLLIILKPLIIGLVIAYLLFPLINFLDNNIKKITGLKKGSRLLSILITYALIFILTMVLIDATYDAVSGEISNNKNITAMVNSVSDNAYKYSDLYNYLNKRINGSDLSSNEKKYLNKDNTQVYNYVSKSFKFSFKIFKNTTSLIINIFLAVCVSFYCLYYYDHFKRRYFKLMRLFFKEQRIQHINYLFREIDNIFAKFIRGQLIDSIIVGLLCGIGLVFTGIRFPLLLGFIVGLFNIVPYVGPFASNIPIVFVGILSPHPMVTVWALLVLFIVHKINSVIISPKVLGDATGHNPVFVIMAIFIGGSLSGIIGIILSIPILGIIKLFVLKCIDFKKEKKFIMSMKTID